MPDFKELANSGWHPKGKDGKTRESWKGDFKGVNQVAGWMGKGKSPSRDASEHVARPLSSLKDPAAFGPPPKNVNYHDGAALPNQISPDTRGLGMPLSQEQIQAQQQAEEEEQRLAEEEPKPEPRHVPFRADTTGLLTAHLSPPLGRKDGADGRILAPTTKQKPPGLPPRLPPRQDLNPVPSPSPTNGAASPASDVHRGFLNQCSLDRLGAAGVSVSGLGIGGPTSPHRGPAQVHTPGSDVPQLNEPQSRFSRLPPTSAGAERSNEGMSLAQKQAAFKTVSSFRNDPSSISLSDARNAASTANNFHERHGDQVKSGWQSVSRLNDKYGVSDKIGSYDGIGSPQTSKPASPAIEMTDNTQGGHGSVLGKKKPPPPPIKKATLASSRVSRDARPPPFPLARKPQPQLRNSS